MVLEGRKAIRMVDHETWSADPHLTTHETLEHPAVGA
jgi:hypothetical protein